MKQYNHISWILCRKSELTTCAVQGPVSDREHAETVPSTKPMLALARQVRHEPYFFGLHHFVHYAFSLSRRAADQLLCIHSRELVLGRPRVLVRRDELAGPGSWQQRMARTCSCHEKRTTAASGLP